MTVLKRKPSGWSAATIAAVKNVLGWSIITDLVDNLNYLSGNTLSLDQTTPETIENGIPLLDQTSDVFNNSKHLINREYVDEKAIGGGGFSAPVFFRTDDSDISTYKRISYTNETSETELTGTITSSEGKKLIRTYLYDDELNTTTLNAGVYTANYRVKVNDTMMDTHFVFEAFVRETGGTETVLFESNSPELNKTTYETLRHSSNQPEFTVNETDRFGVRIYLETNRTNTVTVNSKVGGEHGSYFLTPVALRHSLLRARDAANSHPISAITDLQTELDDKTNQSDFTGIYDDNYLSAELTEDMILGDFAELLSSGKIKNAISTIDESMSYGSEYVFNSGITSDISMSFDPNNANKFVVGYSDDSNSNYGTAVVGNVSGDTISYGSEYVFNSGHISEVSISFDPDTANKFVVSYRDWDNSNYGKSVVGTVSGDTISYGSEYVFNSGSTNDISMSFDPNNANQFVVSYRDFGNSQYGTAVVGTVSGDTISYGSEYVFNAGITSDISMSFDPNNENKFVISYKDGGNSSYGTAVVGTVSGDTLSFGSEYVFNSGDSRYNLISFDFNTENKFVVAYRDADNSDYGTAVVGTVSGNTINFGSEYVFYSGGIRDMSISFEPNTPNKFVVTYQDYDNSSYGTAVVGTVSGDTISYGSKYVFNSGSTDDISISFDPNTENKFVVAYNNSTDGTAVVGTISGNILSFGSEYKFKDVPMGDETSDTLISFNPNNSNKFVVTYKVYQDSYYSAAKVGNATYFELENPDNVIGVLQESGVSGTTKPTQVVGIVDNFTGLTPASNYYLQTDGTLSTSNPTGSLLVGKAFASNKLKLNL